MKLKLGFMSNQELADWFGICKKSYENKRLAKLKELENFAVFQPIRGGVNISEILIPEYSKLGSEAYRFVRDHVDETWDATGLDTCSRVGLRLKEKFADNLTLSESTIQNYTCRSRNELYGKPFLGGGKIGSCIYIWCKKFGQGADAILEFFTPEENEIKKELMKKYFGDTTEKQLAVQQMVDSHEIKEEEAWRVLQLLTNYTSEHYLAFIRELSDKVDCDFVIRGTLIERYGENGITLKYIDENNNSHTIAIQENKSNQYILNPVQDNSFEF